MRGFALLRSALTLAALAGGALAGGALLADVAPRIVYVKSFPGSTPAWVQIRLEKSGAAVYQEDPKDEDPLEFDIAEDKVSQIFALADKLDHFAHPLETRLKLANMGMKTLRYEDGKTPHEVKFNYSDNPDARAINDWFEQMIDTERAYIQLESAVRYDKLGVQNALLQVEVVRDQKRLVSPPQFLPLLDQVAKNEAFLHMARERAATLAEKIRAEK
jgi:hypothetical protein